MFDEGPGVYDRRTPKYGDLEGDDFGPEEKPKFVFVRSQSLPSFFGGTFQSNV